VRHLEVDGVGASGTQLHATDRQVRGGDMGGEQGVGWRSGREWEGVGECEGVWGRCDEDEEGNEE